MSFLLECIYIYIYIYIIEQYIIEVNSPKKYIHIIFLIIDFNYILLKKKSYLEGKLPVDRKIKMLIN